MFGDHFYHATMRKSVAIFGTLFNNLKVLRKASDGSVLNSSKSSISLWTKTKVFSQIRPRNWFRCSYGYKIA